MKIRILISLLLFVAGTTAAIAQQDKPHWEIEAGMCVANLYDHANMNPFILDEINTDDDVVSLNWFVYTIKMIVLFYMMFLSF